MGRDRWRQASGRWRPASDRGRRARQERRSRSGAAANGRPRSGRASARGRRHGGLQEPSLPPALVVASGHPDRRQHGHLRADRHHRQVDGVGHGGQRPDPDVPRPSRPVLGRGGRLRGSARPAPGPDRDERAPRRGVRCRLPRRRQPRPDLPPQPVHLDRDRLLRAGRSGDDPDGRAAAPAARGEWRVHADAQRGVRSRLRIARTAHREDRRSPGADHPGGGALFRGCRLLLDPAGEPPQRPRSRHPGDGRPDGAGGRRRPVAVARGALIHPSPPRDPMVAQLPRRRSSACSASSGRTSPV